MVAHCFLMKPSSPDENFIESHLTVLTKFECASTCCVLDVTVRQSETVQAPALNSH